MKFWSFPEPALPMKQSIACQGVVILDTGHHLTSHLSDIQTRLIDHMSVIQKHVRRGLTNKVFVDYKCTCSSLCINRYKKFYLVNIMHSWFVWMMWLTTGVWFLYALFFSKATLVHSLLLFFVFFLFNIVM